MALSAALYSLTPLTAEASTAKHLAGPAEEIELMHHTHFEADAIHSKTALIPIDTSVNKGSWSNQLVIDGENPAVLLFSDQTDWQLEVRAPGLKSALSAAAIATRSGEASLGMGNRQYPAMRYEFDNAPAGLWDVSIKGADAKGYLMVSSDTPHYLKSWRNGYSQVTGERVYFHFSAYTNNGVFRVVNRDLNLIQNAQLEIKTPAGEVLTVPGFDDGLQVDQQAGDGVFYGSFVADKAGEYQVQVQVKGTTPEGLPFYRTSEHVVAVASPQLKFNKKAVQVSILDNNRVALDIGVDSVSNTGTHYRVLAEVWGSSLNGRDQYDVPVSWLSTMATVENGRMRLQLDNRWVMAAQAYAPFEIRNLRIQDTRYYMNQLQTDRLDIELPSYSKNMRSAYDGRITQDMLMGQPPQTTGKAQRAGGAKLMLVHGYCSGDAWGPVQGQFANSVKFTDFNQNRSHDQFARLIDTFGDNFDSFGVVAHSQGGAASLHLYTYYWSGLDNAGSGRLIQSVGTPYQGSPLAGTLALIGDIFGAGCGRNNDLTPSGASAWLSGIPTWARSKVNYYSTSFTDKWWRPDWCNFASDFVLSDPEDGVVERFRAQLPGAVNRGHKTGQCHTTGMRDPAQTRDSGRNATMSNNAAR